MSEATAKTVDSQPAAPPVLEMIEADIPDTWRPNRALVQRVNWRVADGDFWFIGGLQHSGKTDLLAVAAGIVPPLRGQCLLFGADQAASVPARGTLQEALKVSLVFDGGRLLHHLTLAENVALPLAYHHNLRLEQAVAQIEPLLELVGVHDRRDSFPANVGRNWQQRTGLARALVHAPDLLLIDSPLSGLDPLDARWWVTTLHQLREGGTVAGQKRITLVVTGDTMGTWKTHANRFAILKDSRLHVLAGLPGSTPEEQPYLDHLLPAELAPT